MIEHKSDCVFEMQSDNPILDPTCDSCFHLSKMNELTRVREELAGAEHRIRLEQSSADSHAKQSAHFESLYQMEADKVLVLEIQLEKANKDQRGLCQDGGCINEQFTACRCGRPICADCVAPDVADPEMGVCSYCRSCGLEKKRADELAAKITRLTKGIEEALNIKLACPDLKKKLAQMAIDIYGILKREKA